MMNRCIQKTILNRIWIIIKQQFNKIQEKQLLSLDFIKPTNYKKRHHWLKKRIRKIHANAVENNFENLR